MSDATTVAELERLMRHERFGVSLESDGWRVSDELSGRDYRAATIALAYWAMWAGRVRRDGAKCHAASIA